MAAPGPAHDQLAAVRDFEGCGHFLLRPGQAMGAIGQHDGRPAGIGGRRHPGIDARFRALGERAEAERGAQPIRGAVANHDQQREDAEQQQRAQREGVVAVGARRGMADPQFLQQCGEPLAVHAPQGFGAGIAGAERQRVLVGGGGPVLDAGNRLDAADGCIARRPAHARQCHQGGGEGQGEQAEHDLVRQLGQLRPQSRERDGDEQARQPQQQPGPRPQLLEQQRPLAQAHLALEGALDRKSRDPLAPRRGYLPCCHGCHSSMERAIALHSLTVLFARGC